MKSVVVALTLVSGAGRMLPRERYGLGVQWHRTDVPEQHRDRGDNDAPANGTHGTRDHVRQGTAAHQHCQLAVARATVGAVSAASVLWIIGGRPAEAPSRSAGLVLQVRDSVGPWHDWQAR